MKPMFFNTEMVKAILADRKTVTRRVVKDPWYIDDEDVCSTSGLVMHRGTAITHGMPYPDSPYSPGDVLYVRETWQYVYDFDGNEHPIEETGRYLYAADDNNPSYSYWVMPDGTHRESMPWRPSIHMPKEAARLFLRVTNVRVERLQDITPKQCVAEGVEQSALNEVGGEFARGMFNDIWDSTIQKKDLPLYGWAANPWVWVIEFEWISKEEAT